MINKRERNITYILVLIFSISLIPIAIISFYNYPSADDYGFSAFSYIMWNETHSILAVLKQAMLTTIDRYFTWQGTFSTIFLMALQPAIFATELYILVPFIMLGSLIFSTLYFLKIIFRDCLNCDKYTYVSVGIFILMISSQCSISKVEAFFWFNGSVHYVLPYCWMLIQIALCCQYIYTQQKKNKERITIGLMSLLSVLLGGGNYITALQTGILFMMMLLLLVINNKFKTKIFIILPFTFYVIAFIMNIIAPGNQVRGAVVLETMGVIESIAMSFKECFLQVVIKWTDVTTILFLLCLLPFLYHLVKQVKLSFSYPLIPLAFSFCLLSAMFTPSLFATAQIGAGRIHNIIYFTYILLIALNLFYMLGWCYRKNLLKTIKYQGVLYVLTVIILGSLSLTKYVLPDKDYLLTTSATRSLMNGEAKEYKETMEARLLLLEGKGNSISLPKITSPPQVLYMDDIGQDSNDWRNQIMCRYYQKEEISLLVE